MKFYYTLALAGGAAAIPQGPAPKPVVESQAFQDAITSDGLMVNLRQLDTIAKANGGNRAFGLPGYAASVEYILSKTQNIPEFVTWTQDFPAQYQEVQSLTLTVGGQNVPVVSMAYSTSTSAEGLTAQMVVGPTGEAACSAQGYAGLDVNGKIVLVQRGGCRFSDAVRAVSSAGGAAVLIYNDVDTPVSSGTLITQDPSFVPSAFLNRADGLRFIEQLNAGQQVDAVFQQTQIIEERVTQNVFTETVGGDSNAVIMLGAHLDSVAAGAGINDDGSGTTLILELANALAGFSVTNKIRFAWWGAEENGLVGSRFYTQNLNTTAADSILAYLNFDMVSRGFFGVFDGDGSSFSLPGADGSAAIEKLFTDELTAKGKTVEPQPFTGGSDYASFINIGKPIGGLFTGADPAQDECYHQACDDINNPNPEVLTTNAKAAAHVLSVLAVRGSELIPKSTNPFLKERSLFERAPIEWTIRDGDRHLATCGHDIQ